MVNVWDFLEAIPDLLKDYEVYNPVGEAYFIKFFMSANIPIVRVFIHLSSLLCHYLIRDEIKYKFKDNLVVEDCFSY